MASGMRLPPRRSPSRGLGRAPRPCAASATGWPRNSAAALRRTTANEAAHGLYIYAMMAEEETRALDASGVDGATTVDRRIRIVLADDHAVVRSGLRLLLDSEADFEVVAEASDVDGARRYVRGHHPAVLVLDLNMPGGSSLEA